MMSKTMAQLYTNDSIENENDILKFSRDVVELFNMIFWQKIRDFLWMF